MWTITGLRFQVSSFGGTLWSHKIRCAKLEFFLYFLEKKVNDLKLSDDVYILTSFSFAVYNNGQLVVVYFILFYFLSWRNGSEIRRQTRSQDVWDANKFISSWCQFKLTAFFPVYHDYFVLKFVFS